MALKVLMFGWEFPPWNTGGLGTACHGLTKGLKNKGVNVLFVLPKAKNDVKQKSHVDIMIANNLDVGDIEFEEIDSLMRGYMSPEEYSYQYNKMSQLMEKSGSHDANMYGNDLFEEAYRYSKKAGIIAKYRHHDVIHAHDWMTYKAGIEAKKVSGKPLIVHVHATEFDRTGGHPNQYIYDLEREGMHAADAVVCVSNYTKNMILKHYGVPENKINVVHNAVEFNNFDEPPQVKDTDKIVLFLGRITIQKGPDWFLYAAKKVLEVEPKARFIFAGGGDMEPYIIEKAAELGINQNVLFAGFLRGKDIDRAYKMASVYVMPSISEPFGITPLEAMRNGTPVIMSKQSGVSEVVDHAFKVDFWDTEEMANKILGILKYEPLKHEMSRNGSQEVRKFNWDEPAAKCIGVYNKVLNQNLAS